jgi:hypothetical protein
MSPSVDSRRRSAIILFATLTALTRAGAADEPARSFRAALVPQLSVGAAAERLPTGWIGLAYAKLSWPLDGLRHDPALLASARRTARQRQLVDERMAELRRRREALRLQARDAERQLDLDEAQAELDALEGRP